MLARLDLQALKQKRDATVERSRGGWGGGEEGDAEIGGSPRKCTWLSATSSGMSRSVSVMARGGAGSTPGIHARAARGARGYVWGQACSRGCEPSPALAPLSLRDSDLRANDCDTNRAGAGASHLLRLLDCATDKCVAEPPTQSQVRTARPERGRWGKRRARRRGSRRPKSN